jgi:hypothetical protein
LIVDVRVPASATPDEAEAIVTAIQMILGRQPGRGPSMAIERSKWASAARREALDDRV